MTMRFIASATGTGNAGSFDFFNIPQHFSHLQVRVYGRQYSNGTAVFAYFNGDAASTNYSQHYLMGDGATVYAGGASNQPYFGIDLVTSSSMAANTHGVGIIDILDYTNTSKNKTIRTISGWDLNGSGRVWMWGGMWRNTNAITSLVITPGFSSASRADLYGFVDTTATGA